MSPGFRAGACAALRDAASIETETGAVKVQWPVTEILIDSISILDRKEKRREDGVA